MAEQEHPPAATSGTPQYRNTEATSLGEITDAAQETARHALNRVSGLAGQATGAAAAQMQDMAEGQVRSAADMAGSIAEAVNAAAEKLEQSSPESARYVRQAARTIESLAGDMHSKSIGDLMHGASEFARRQPAAFMAAASVAGFMAARFLKSSSPGASGSEKAGEGAQQGQEASQGRAVSSTPKPTASAEETWPGMTSTPAEKAGAGVPGSPSRGGVSG